jgi:RNA polymerase sigma-70 factor (ECF subfamily)
MRCFGSLERRLNAEERTDEALMAALCQGRETALAELVRRYQNDIFRFCLHYLRDVEVARELAQETFIRVYTARGRFDVERKFRPWALCIARNLCLNELKRKKAVTMETLEEYASTARDETGAVLRFSGSGPAEALMAAERRELLARAIDGLDEESRELVTLRFFERMPAKEIAEVVGSTEGAVRTRLHRVLVTLRAKYAPCRDGL